MFLDQPRLVRREMDSSKLGQVIAGSIILGFIGLIIAYYSLRHLRRTHSNPTYLPTTYLKKKWIHWDVKQAPMTRTNAVHLEPISSNPSGPFRSRPSSTADSNANLTAPTTASQTAPSNASALDRNTSVRSIATLPEYAFYPKPTEQVLGRAGERDGIDTVVKFPDIAEAAEEERREEEMEALYQVRLARRTEIAEREERRRLRREARDRGDMDALMALRTRGRAESNSNLDTLRAEHTRLRERERAVSAVSYDGLGVARADGSRVRANSVESEGPLLGDMGDMGRRSGSRNRASMGSIDMFENGRYSQDDLTRPPMYDEISLGAGRDVPPGYAPSAHVSGSNSPRTRPDLSLGSHPVTELDLGALGLGLGPIARHQSASPPVPFPDLDVSDDHTQVDDGRDNDRSSDTTRRGRSGSDFQTAETGRRASATFMDAPTSRRLSPSPRRRVSPPRHIDLPRTSSFPVITSSSNAAEPDATASATTPSPSLTPPSHSPSPTPSTESAPNRMSTLARRRISINDLMGTQGRPADAQPPQKTTYVLHTPPIPSVATPPLGGDRRRSSYLGLPRLGLGGGESAGEAPGGLGVGPSIIVESATPVVGPGGKGRGALGWENERAGR